MNVNSRRLTSMELVKNIIDMLDLFYANKHLFEKIKAYHEEHTPNGDGTS